MPLVLYGSLGGLSAATLNNDGAPKTDKSSAPKAADNAASQGENQTCAKSDEPQYSPTRQSETDKSMQSRVDPGELAAVNQAALDFVQVNSIRGVKHMKTCHDSNGWYMLVFTERGKKTSMIRYNWDSKNKEWSPVFQDKGVTPQQVEFKLKNVAEGEKCWLLK